MERVFSFFRCSWIDHTHAPAVKATHHVDEYLNSKKKFSVSTYRLYAVSNKYLRVLINSVQDLSMVAEL
jgi:hypothetical protein